MGIAKTLFGFHDYQYYGEKKISLTTDANAMVEELLISDYGEHNMLVYPNRRSFRQLYSKYCRNVLVEKNSNRSGNEMILIISYYDTVDNIKHVLKRIGIKTEENRKGDITLMDSVTAYSCSPTGKSYLVNQYHDNSTGRGIHSSNQQASVNRSFPLYYKPYTIFSVVSSLLQHMESIGMRGLCVIADMGSFYLLNRVEELVNYECSYSPRFDKDVRIKAFCCHHRKEVNKVLTREQQINIVGHHNRHLVMTTS